MAQDVQVNIKFDSQDNVTQTVKGMSASITGLEKIKLGGLTGTFGNLGNIMTGLNSTVMLASKAFGYLKDLVYESVDAAAKQQEQEILLNDALKNKGIYTDELSSSLIKYAGALQQVTTFGDEEIINAQRLLVQYGVESDKLNDVTKATLDFAAAKKIDLTSAADLVGKAITTSTNALGRYGIAVSNTKDETLRAEQVISGMAKTFGGSAQSAATTFSGSMKQTANIIGDTKEAIGAIIIENQLFTQSSKSINNVFLSLTKVIIDNKETIIDLTNTGVKYLIKIFVGPLVAAIESVYFIFKGLLVILEFVANGILILASAAINGAKGLLQFANVGGILDDQIKSLDDILITLNGTIDDGNKTISDQVDKFYDAGSGAVKATSDVYDFADSIGNLPTSKTVDITANTKIIADIKAPIDTLEGALKRIGPYVTDPIVKAQIEVEKSRKEFEKISKESKEAADYHEKTGVAAKKYQEAEYKLLEVKRTQSEKEAKEFETKMTKSIDETAKFFKSSTSKDLVGTIGSTIGTALGGPVVGNAVQQIVDIFGEAPDVFKQKWEAIIKGIPDIIKNIIKNIPELIKIIIKELPNLITGLSEALAESMQSPDVIASISTAFVEASPAIAAAFIRAIPKIAKEWAIQSVKMFTVPFKNAIDNLAKYMQMLFPIQFSALEEKFNAIGEKFTAIFDNIGLQLTNLWNGLIELFQPILDGLNAIGEMFVSLGALFMEIITAFNVFFEQIKAFLTQIIETFTAIFESIKTVIVEFYNQITLAAKNFLSSIYLAGRGFVNSILSGAGRFIDELIKGITGAFGDVGGAVSGGAGGILSSIGGALGFQSGGEIPNRPKFANDGFGPAFLNAGENVVDAETNDRLKAFLDRSERGNAPIIVNLTLNEKTLASVLLDLDKRGYRLTA